MGAVSFLQDLAVVMIVAGLVTLVFRRLRQPVVLGYLLAGFIIGPYTPPFPFVRDEASIRTLSELGVVFLMFSLGLDFNLRKLRQVGLPALLAASFEIAVMIWVGYSLGTLFGWPPGESALFGCMLALTSSMIVIKSLRDRDELDQPHGRIVSGISLFDDIFLILLMVLLPGIAQTGGLSLDLLVPALLRLAVFLVTAVIGGLLVVPPLLRYAARFKSDEMLLILSLALCLGVSLLAVKLQFSSALGAFLIGAIVSETRQAGRVTELTAPVRDMFVAVFFVSIGMLIDLTQLAAHAGTILITLFVYLFAKTFACAIGAFFAGCSPRDAMRTGTHMAQVGEFAFVLAGLGLTLGLSGEHLYPIVVSIAAANAFVRPYLVDNADRLTSFLSRVMPPALKTPLLFYASWIAQLRATPARASALRPVRSVFWQICLNVALIAGIIFAAAVMAPSLPQWVPAVARLPGGAPTFAWTVAMLACLPIYVATARKIQAIGMMLAELAITPAAGGPRTELLQRLLANMVWIVGTAAVTIVALLMSAAILPPTPILLVLVVIMTAAILLFGQSFNRIYSRAKFNVLETWHQPPAAPAPPPMPALLHDAKLETVTLRAGGKLIRELDLRARTGATIVALERAGKSVVNPSPDEELRAGDQILLLGDANQLSAAQKLLM